MSTEPQTELRSHAQTVTGGDHPFAWAGLVFALCALLGYFTLRQMLLQLPAARSSIDELRTNAPALTRLIIVGATSAMLNLAALVLSLLGCLMPRRRHTLATFSSLLSAGMLLVLFSVVLVSLLVG
ncbi:MAG: hypothetical protein ACKO2P_21425 [Planctomycetota bacterium]